MIKSRQDSSILTEEQSILKGTSSAGLLAVTVGAVRLLYLDLWGGVVLAQGEENPQDGGEMLR